MYSKNEIVSEIYKSELIPTLCKNMGVKQNDADDLIQEIYMILLEYDDAKIKKMYEDNQLKFFLVRIITNQYFSCNSPYYKKYKKYYQLIDGNIINNECENEEEDSGDND